MRDDSLYLDDIREACCNIKEFIAERDKREFFSDKKSVHAVVRNVEIIGEAARHLSEETRSRYPAIEWELITGMRNRIIHEYFQLDPDIIWNVGIEEVPALLKAVS